MNARWRQLWQARRGSVGGKAAQLVAQTYAVTLLGLLVGITSARSLAVGERGTLALLLLAGQLFSRFGSLGFEQLLQRDGLTRFRLSTFYAAAGLGSLALLPLMWAFMQLTDLPRVLVLSTLGAAFVVAVLRMNVALLTHLERFRELFVLNLLQASLQLLLFLAVFTTHRYEAFYAAWLAAVALAGGLSLRRVQPYRRAEGSRQPLAVWKASRRYASVAFPETVIAFCLELPLVRLTLGEVSAGLYAISNTLTNIYFQVFTALSAIVIRQPLRGRGAIYLVVALMGLVMALVSAPLTALLFGAQYAGAAAFVHWMLPTTFMLGVARIEQVTSSRLVPFAWQGALVALFCVALGLTALLPPPSLVVPYIAGCYVTYSLILIGLSRWGPVRPGSPSGTRT